MPAYAFKKGEKVSRKTFNKKILINRSLIANIFRKKSLFSRVLNGLIFSLEITLRLLLDFSRKSNLVIYTTEPAFLNFFALLIYKIRKIPYILIIYDLYPEVLVNNKILKKENILIKIWHLINKISYSNASEIIVLSDSIANKFKKFDKEITNKISVIPSWCDHETIIPREKKDNALAKELGVKETFNILYSGNQGKCHDLVTIIETALLLKDLNNIKFIFIGDGVENKKIKDLSLKYKLDNCIFLPFQDKELLPYSLTLADLSIVSISANAEGLVAPSKLYGHLSISKPIAIISPVESYLKTIVMDNKLGEWFNNGDSEGLADFIKRLIIDKNLSFKYSKESRKYLLKNANFFEITDKYYDLIKRNLP